MLFEKYNVYSPDGTFKYEVDAKVVQELVDAGLAYEDENGNVIQTERAKQIHRNRKHPN